jgi:hypothetical protein
MRSVTRTKVTRNRIKKIPFLAVVLRYEGVALGPYFYFIDPLWLAAQPAVARQGDITLTSFVARPSQSRKLNV